MAIRLNNEQIQIIIEEKGAELTSMKMNSSDIEYIWTGDPAYWSRHAPILFPIVGKVVNGTYLVEGKKYPMGQHGFARDRVFEVIEQHQEQVVLRLVSDATSLELYPFRFELRVSYLLVETAVRIAYTVINIDTQTIYFSIGAHPGFNCPLKEVEQMEDYYFEFEKVETANAIGLTEDGLLVRAANPCLQNQITLPIHPNLFRQDALVFNTLTSEKISLKSNKGSHKITVDFKGFPFLGLWSKPSGAPFVCIEPWFGHADYADFAGEFCEKEDSLSLEVGKRFHCEYSIQIHG